MPVLEDPFFDIDQVTAEALLPDLSKGQVVNDRKSGNLCSLSVHVLGSVRGKRRPAIGLAQLDEDKVENKLRLS